MRTFAEISNEQLLIETIRRLRTIKVLMGGRKAPEGTTVEKVFKALLESGLMLESDLKQTLKNMLESGDILLIGYARFRIPTQQLPVMRRRGVISKLHPDAKIAHWQYFTESGTPIIAKYRSGGLIYPNNNISHWMLRLERVYVMSDGLPATIQAIQKGDSAQPY